MIDAERRLELRNSGRECACGISRVSLRNQSMCSSTRNGWPQDVTPASTR
jgi:hypothetical protein